MPDLCTACNAELTAYQVLVCRSTLCPSASLSIMTGPMGMRMLRCPTWGMMGVLMSDVAVIALVALVIAVGPILCALLFDWLDR